MVVSESAYGREAEDEITKGTLVNNEDAFYLFHRGKASG
jgi:hypothetical protein